MHLSRSVVLSLLVSLAAIAVSPPVVAQSSAGPFTFSSSSSPCARIAVTAQSSVVIKVTGTFSMTLQPEVSVQGQTPDNTVVTPSTSTTASKQSTITATGSYSSAVGSYDTFLVCVTSYVSGTATVYLNASPATNASLFGSGGVATTVPFSGVTASTNTNALLEGTGGSNSPAGSGQIAGSQLWMQAGLPAASASGVSSGGNISTNHSITIQYTFNTAAGETLPSNSVVVATPASCTPANNNCSVTVTAPTIPSGFTGYTVYNNDNSGSPQKNASCTNITTNCTITAAGAGATVPTTATAFVQPANVQASECPLGVIPTIFMPDNSGNYRTWAGVDPNSNNGQTSGTFEICHRTWFTDQQVTPPGGNNAFVLFDHTYGTGTSASNQDRTVWMQGQSPVNDSAARYAEEVLQLELDFACNGCTINGSPDAEVTTISSQLNTFNASTNWTTTGYGTNAIQGRVFRSGAGFDSTGISAIYGNASNSNATATGGSLLSGLRSAFSSTVSASNLSGIGVRIDTPANHNFGHILGIYASSGGFTPTRFATTAFNAGDPFIDQRTHNWDSDLNGMLYANGLTNSDVTTLAMNAAVNLSGSLTTSQVSPPSSPFSGGCSGGTSQYTYKFVYVDNNGGAAATPTLSTNSTCTNPLTAGNPVTLNPAAALANVSLGSIVRIDVYRTGGPMATGKIGSITCNSNWPINGCNAFSDTGLAADGGTAPSVNTTGTVSTAGYTQNSGNKFFVSTNFTTAANTSLQTITGLSFNLLPVAANYQFHCALAYSQGTANAAVAFGIQAATVNPTNIFATGTIGTSTTAATSGVLATLSSTTATSIVSATPSAITTNFTATLDGTIEEPANDAGQVINIMVSTATSGDAVTVLRGSYCYVY